MRIPQLFSITNVWIQEVKRWDSRPGIEIFFFFLEIFFFLILTDINALYILQFLATFCKLIRVVAENNQTFKLIAYCMNIHACSFSTRGKLSNSDLWLFTGVCEPIRNQEMQYKPEVITIY